MKSVIISDNQVFHHVSPKFSNSPDDSPDQELKRIKISYHLALVPSAPPGLDSDQPVGHYCPKKENNCEKVSAIFPYFINICVVQMMLIHSRV